MRQRSQRNRSRDGLFVWTADGDTTPAEITDNPRARPCPFCQAAPGHGCRTRTRRAVVAMVGYHPARRHPEVAQ